MALKVVLFNGVLKSPYSSAAFNGALDSAYSGVLGVMQHIGWMELCIRRVVKQHY